MKLLELLAPVVSLAIVIALMQFSYGEALDGFFKWLEIALTSRII